MAGKIVLETPRLLLREFDEGDAEAMFRLAGDPLVQRYVGDPSPATVEDALEIICKHPMTDYRKYGFGRWACVLKETGEVIGFSGLKYLDDRKEVDIGYRFLPAHWGKGLATESARPAIEYGFTKLNLDYITGLVVPENVASVRVLQKLGLVFADMIEMKVHGPVQVAHYVIHHPDRPGPAQ